MTFDLVFLHILYLRLKKTFSFFLVLWDIVRSLFVSFAINWGHIKRNWQEPLLPEDGGREAEAATCQLTEPRRSLRSLCSGWTVPACCACLKRWFWPCRGLSRRDAAILRLQRLLIFSIRYNINNKDLSTCIYLSFMQHQRGIFVSYFR